MDDIKEEQPAKKSPVILALKLAFSMLILSFVVYKIDSHKTVAYLKGANYLFLLLAFISFVASKIFSAYRLNNFFKAKGLTIAQISNVKLYLLAMFYGLFVPGIGADGYRVYWLKKNAGFEIKNGVWISLLDRLSGLVALVFLIILFFCISSYEHDFKMYSLFGLPLVIFTFYFAIKIFFKEYIPIFNATTILSFIVQLLQVLCVFFVLLSLKVPSNHIEYIFIFLISSLAFVVPIFGFREAAFVFGANWLGLDKEISAAISVLFYLCLAATSIIGIYYFYYPNKITLSKS